MLLVLDSNEFIFGFGVARKPSCEALLDAITEVPAHAIRIPRLIVEEVGRHLTPEEFREFVDFIMSLTVIDEDFVVSFEFTKQKVSSLPMRSSQPTLSGRALARS